MKIRSFIVLATITALAACNGNNANQTSETDKKDSMSTANTGAHYANVQFAVDKDLVCEMPVKSGVSDTVHYNGGVYGFCSATCKEDFKKDPASYLTAKK
jgi:YHS domain-containing protein